MKKITFIVLLSILPFVGFGQTFDFTNSDDGWSTLGGFASANDATFITLTTVDGDGTKKNPTVATLTAGVDTSINSVVGITLKNKDATGPNFLRVSFPKTGGDPTKRVYKNSDITTGNTGFITYWFDLTNGTHWVGTMDDVKLHFKSAGNTNYILPNNPNNISIDIDKIEFATSIPTTLQESYTFDSDGNTEGFSAVNGSISGPTGGVLIFTPTATKFAKLEQLSHHINADANKFVRIIIKNNSALNDQLRLVFPKAGGGNSTTTQTITVSDTGNKTYGFDLSGNVEWTGDLAFTIGIGSLVDGKAQDAGTVEINSIVFNSTVLAVRKNKLTNFTLYPNPVNGRLNFNSLTDISKIEVYNLAGQRLLQHKSFSNNSFDVSTLSSGVYLINVEDVENRSVTKRIIVNR